MEYTYKLSESSMNVKLWAILKYQEGLSGSYINLNKSFYNKLIMNDRFGN